MKNFLILILLSGSNFIFAQETQEYYDSIAKQQYVAHSKHLHPLPLECAGVKIGYGSHTDSAVVALYGKGLFNDEDGHGGARFFTDPSKKVIIKTVIGTDDFIEEVAFTLVDFPFDFVRDKVDSIPVAKNLNTDNFLIKNIKFGNSPDIIKSAFGTPNQDNTEEKLRFLIYEDDYELWAEVLYYSAIFVFSNNQLIRISIYDGD